MAEGMHAWAVVRVVRDKLASALVGDAAANIPANSRADLEIVMRRIKGISAALEDSERWLMKFDYRVQCLEKVAYDIWDMVDEIQANKGAAPIGRIRPLRAIAAKATWTNNIKEKMEEIAEACLGFFDKTAGRYIQFDVGPLTVGETIETRSFEPPFLVGRGEDVQSILDLLFPPGVSDTTKLPVLFPIFGFAGVGKTSLAQVLFNHTGFQDYARAWVYVSRDFDLMRIGRSIIEGIEQSPINLESMELICRCLDELLGGGKKVLIVLDDIWEENDSKLDELKRMLLGVGDQRRNMIVIVTTHDEGIARKMCTGISVEPYKLHPLSDDLCWEIIKRESGFESRNDKQEMDKIGREIATKCGGVPLAAKILGYVLGDMRSINEWSAVISTDDIWGPCSDSRGTMFASLRVSYQRMPPDMRLCFAYLGTLPENQNIAKDDLIHRWIALGLIEPCDGISRHQTAEYIISRLLDISFLQLGKLVSIGGKDDKGVIWFAMNSMVHSFARSAIRNSLVVVDGENQTSINNTEHFRYAVFTNFDVASSKLSSILPAELRALSLLGCIRMQLGEDSFSFGKYLRVLELREPSMQKLPDSICLLGLLGYLNLSGCSGLQQLPKSFGNLTSVLHINLSGCSGLEQLPESFGNLRSMLHINLSGCSGLEQLPESFGNLTSVLHINLSGCSGLEQLPESFGNLTSVLHINLSGCHGLDDLPKSFCKLNNLEHLDLSFCSCLREFPTALGGLTNLGHLNLSHPCCYAVEHKDHLEQLNGVWAKLTKLQYLNLSMFMNPIFCYLPEGDSIDCFKSIKGLSSLEHLDLSHNIFLVDLPESLADLNKLHTLNLSGCIRLKRIAKKIAEMQCLKMIVLRKCRSLESYSFAVHTDDGAYRSNVVQLEDVSCKELEINCLEKVKSIEKAKRIRLDKKQKLEKLTLGWAGGCHGSYVKDEVLLAELVPPQNLQRFELKGFRGKCLPLWLTSSICSHLPNLVGVTMEDIPSCRTLPPLFLLPNLQHVVFRKMANITKVDAGELSGGNRAVLHGLLQFTLDDLENLQEFNTIYHTDGEEFVFPIVNKLVIQNCPNVKFVPFPPWAQRLQISSCEQVMSSLPKREVGGQGKGVEGPSSSSSMASARVTELVVENCKVPLGDWSLLHHLPGLRSLEIRNCNDLTSSPEIIQVLSSLQSLCLYQCNGMTSLLEYLCDLSSLQELTIDGCQDVKYLPQSIDKVSKLKDLRILRCPDLERWCESEENKNKLAHIPNLSRTR